MTRKDILDWVSSRGHAWPELKTVARQESKTLLAQLALPTLFAQLALGSKATNFTYMNLLEISIRATLQSAPLLSSYPLSPTLCSLILTLSAHLHDYFTRTAQYGWRLPSSGGSQV